MKSLLVVGTVVLLVGVIMALFGAVYSTTFDTATSYYLCPIWYGPIPTFPFTINLANCWYLVGPSPPSQLAFFSFLGKINYLPNFIGIALILLGIIVVVRSHTSPSTPRHPIVNRENDHPQTS